MTDGFLRLVPCPHCESRQRALAVHAGRLVGHCLGCGQALARPLDTERTAGSGDGAP